MTTEETPSVAFDSLGLEESLLKAVIAMGYESCTPIQAEGIPPLLEGRSVIGRARTGSGKTAAFGLPMLQIALKAKPGPVQGLVLAPTRELALQVHAALETYAKGSDLRVLPIYGGSPYPPQLRALRQGVDIVVGTPGRVIDHLDRGTLKLGDLKMLVLDEADEMLRMGFIEDVEKVFELVPDTCQAALFSATMPGPIARIAKAHMSDPLVVQVETQEMSATHIKQVWMRVPQEHKLEALLRLLRSEETDAVLVFSRTRRGCAELAQQLGQRGFNSDELHGDLTQAARERVLQRLRDHRLKVVVATDVAARGIDVAHITHVVNMDLPMEKATYVHRIGRTGRAGRSGTAVTFVTPREQRKLMDLMRVVKVDITQVDVPSDAMIARRQQGTLIEKLKAAVESPNESIFDFIANLKEEKGWKTKQIAAAALEMLAKAERVDLSAPEDDQPPAWARRSKTKPRQNKRLHGEAPSRGGPAGDNVELFLPAGRFAGVRAGDIVGALTQGCGVPGGAVGRVTVVDRKSFVSLPREWAEHVVNNNKGLELRGKHTPVFLARPQSERPPFRPRKGQRPGGFRKEGGGGAWGHKRGRKHHK